MHRHENRTPADDGKGNWVAQNENLRLDRSCICAAGLPDIIELPEARIRNVQTVTAVLHRLRGDSKRPSQSFSRFHATLMRFRYVTGIEMPGDISLASDVAVHIF
jgi:hypothetical protein